MITEKATERWDLPHAYTAGDSDGQCQCGRSETSKLHAKQPLEQARESASHREPFITEKGT